jgi:signal transduction histidine kinase
VTFRKPSGPTLVTLVLLVLVPALAALQYRWVGQLSVAERERMQRNLLNAADQFRDAFDDEVRDASVALQVGPTTAREGESQQYSERYTRWVNTANYPQIVADVYLVDADGEGLRLRRWDVENHVFEPAPWTASLELLRPQFERDREAFQRQPRIFDTRDAGYRGDDSLIVLGLAIFEGPPGRPRQVQPVFGFTIIQLDMPSMEDVMLAELARRHFIDARGDSYRVAVTAFDDPTRVLYRSDAEATLDVAAADATAPLLAPLRQRRGGPRGPVNNRAGSGPGGLSEIEERGRWRLLVQHESGSLEAAVGFSRRRNLALSFGSLLLLTGSIGLLTVTSRNSQKLAKQQMEFVAGVSHELRTPVAVIRSASENLAQGVVSGDRVKRYGQLLESEARRLGEMVERVLQYAGIESGLGFGTRVPLAPADIIETAVESALPLVGPGDVNVQREIPEDLPPVMGDAAALRSAVQNLIANAVKYGGRDRWVGIKAQHVKERRRSEVQITVSDHGAGIPASELPHIFDPFYRGADAIDRQIHGNGLGLSLVKRIVNAHGGRVSVATRAGAGSSFTIALPCAEADAQPSAVSTGAQVGAHS